MYNKVRLRRVNLLPWTSSDGRHKTLKTSSVTGRKNQDGIAKNVGARNIDRMIIVVMVVTVIIMNGLEMTVIAANRPPTIDSAPPKGSIVEPSHVTIVLRPNPLDRFAVAPSNHSELMGPGDG